MPRARNTGRRLIKNAGKIKMKLTCACGKCSLEKFSLKEIKDIINYSKEKPGKESAPKELGIDGENVPSIPYTRKGCKKEKEGLKKLREFKP